MIYNQYSLKSEDNSALRFFSQISVAALFSAFQPFSLSAFQPFGFYLYLSLISGAAVRHSTPHFACGERFGSTRPTAKKLTKAKPNTVFKEYFRRYCVGNPRQATAFLAVSSLSRQKSFLKNCFALKTQSCILSVLRLAFVSFTLASLAEFLHTLSTNSPAVFSHRRRRLSGIFPSGTWLDSYVTKNRTLSRVNVA